MRSEVRKGYPSLCLWQRSLPKIGFYTHGYSFATSGFFFKTLTFSYELATFSFPFTFPCPFFTLSRYLQCVFLFFFPPFIIRLEKNNIPSLPCETHSDNEKKKEKIRKSPDNEKTAHLVATQGRPLLTAATSIRIRRPFSTFLAQSTFTKTANPSERPIHPYSWSERLDLARCH